MADGAVLVGGKNGPVQPLLAVAINTVTLAEVNAGKTVLPPTKGSYRYQVINFSFIPNGSFATLTTIVLQTTATVPVVIASLAQAQATDDNYLGPESTGITLGAGFQIELAEGDGIEVAKTGSAGITATDILVTVTYRLIGPSVQLNPALGDDQR